MKFVTFRQGDRTSVGALMQDDVVVDLAEALPAAQNERSIVDVITATPAQTQAIRSLLGQPNAKSTYRLAALQLLAPIPRPQKNVFCVGRNYKEHIIEGARARGVQPSFPRVPEFFSKPYTTVIGPDAGIQRHSKNTSQLDYEVELAIIIGKRTRDVAPNNAIASIFGYTIVNDISARDAQLAHGQWFKGKSFDTFCPMGPCVVTADEFGDASGHRIMLKVNGETRQDSNTSDLLFSVADIVSALSAGTTLEAGDIISTGTPSGVALGMTPQRWLQVGDVVEAEIEGIGVLRNVVVE